MTGAELLAELLQGGLSDYCRSALDGCVLLTAEEAKKVRAGIDKLAALAWVSHEGDPWYAENAEVSADAARDGEREALALLGGEKP